MPILDNEALQICFVLKKDLLLVTVSNTIKIFKKNMSPKLFDLLLLLLLLLLLMEIRNYFELGRLFYFVFENRQVREVEKYKAWKVSPLYFSSSSWMCNLIQNKILLKFFIRFYSQN